MVFSVCHLLGRRYRSCDCSRDEVPAGIDERRQRHRTDDRNAVFQVGNEIGIAAGEDDLLNRNRDGVDALARVRRIQRNGGAVRVRAAGWSPYVGKNETGEIARISKPRMSVSPPM